MVRVANVTSFVVDDVIPAAKPVYVEPLSEHVAKRFRRGVLLLPDAQKNVINAALGRLSRRDIAPDRMQQYEQQASADVIR